MRASAVRLIEVEPADGSDPIENYRVIRNELEQYSDVLANKPEVVVLTKTDLLGGEAGHALDAADRRKCDEIVAYHKILKKTTQTDN